MKNQKGARIGGTKGWLVVTGVAILMALAVGPALAGTASAAPVQLATGSPATQWAYGGQGSVTGTVTSGQNTLSWNATFGWTVIYTETNTSASTVELEEQRTVGIQITTTLTGPNLSATYTYHGAETDTAFVNLTNQSTVYVNGQPVPALGIDNESVSVQASVDQSLQVTTHDHSHSAWLNVSGAAQASVQFAPALGIIPLNLTGVNQWNSSATATPQASWNISYAWADLGWNGTTRSGQGSFTGNWTASGPVTLTGYKVNLVHVFSDHESRIAILLIVQGPVDAYDGFILVPHGFDLFGGSVQPYDADALGSASVGSGSSQTLFVSNGVRGPQVTAAQTTFGAGMSAVSSLGEPVSGLAPAANSGPSATVTANPMSVADAQTEAACLTSGCSGAASAATSGLLGVEVIALAVVAVVGTISVIEWRSYARRRSQKGLVGGYGESWTNGVPPSVLGPTSPAMVEGSSSPEAPRPPQP